MTPRFVELDWRPTRMGDLSLRRRTDPALGVEVWEVKLGDEFLMSSLFHEAEIALARLGLAAVPATAGNLDVLVGGLGLGYTAAAVLDDPRVTELEVVDALDAVIDWHRDGLLPLGPTLTGDPRCRLTHADFFALMAGPAPTRRRHAVLVDIDHTPRHLLDASHGPFYEPAGLARVADHLYPGGVFALWSDDPPDDAFLAVLGAAFARASAEVVAFANPLTGGQSTNTVYVATTPA